MSVAAIELALEKLDSIKGADNPWSKAAYAELANLKRACVSLTGLFEPAWQHLSDADRGHAVAVMRAVGGKDLDAMKTALSRTAEELKAARQQAADNQRGAEIWMWRCMKAEEERDAMALALARKEIAK